MRGNESPRIALLSPKSLWREIMADGGGSGGVGILGVFVGAILVVMVGVGVLFATGKIGGSGSNTSRLKVELPKATTVSK